MQVKSNPEKEMLISNEVYWHYCTINGIYLSPMFDIKCCYVLQR